MLNSKRMISKFDYERIQNVLKDINTEEHLHVRKLKEKLDNARKIDPIRIKQTIITMNTKFRLKNIGNGNTREFVLVFPDDSDHKKNKISILDEIGSEIFAREIGDVIYLNNTEKVYYLIEDITYQPEAAGDYYL
jgi:regulator of nucleoside diphosphate kinase